MDNRVKILLGFVAGAAAGAITGILLAPDKGKVTRENLAQKTTDLSGDVAEKLQKGVDKFNSFTQSAFSLVNKYGENNGGSQVSENIGNTL